MHITLDQVLAEWLAAHGRETARRQVEQVEQRPIPFEAPVRRNVRASVYLPPKGFAAYAVLGQWHGMK